MDPRSLTSLAERLGGTVVEARPLHGGVSASVVALTLRGAGGEARTVVLRSLGAHWKEHARDRLELERELMTTLCDRGFPVPRPLGLEEEPPVLILPYVEPGARPPLAEALRAMGRTLAALHRTPIHGLPALPERRDPRPDLWDFLEEPGWRPRLEALPKPAADAPIALLHGDFWGNNLLWRDGALAAVLDWEDSAVGDPLADVAGARVELVWGEGPEAAEAFTAAYVEASGRVLDPTRLALWELYVCRAGLTWLPAWGLPEADTARIRERSAPLLDRLARALEL